MFVVYRPERLGEEESDPQLESGPLECWSV